MKKILATTIMLSLLINVYAGKPNTRTIKVNRALVKERNGRYTPPGNGSIPIIAWVGTPELTIAAYAEMRAAGITQTYFPFANADAVQQALDIGQKTGIKVFICCPELQSNPALVVKRFMNHPANAGYFIKDEPNTSLFSSLAGLVKQIKALDNKHICYINLLPNYADANGLGAANYEQYVDRYLQTVPVQILSFDHYPIIGTTGQSIRPEWYQNLAVIANAAAKYNKPFWAFALSTSFSPYPVPTIGSLRLQVFTNLAYGAQAIQYFTYLTLNDPSVANFNNAPIAGNGVKTPVYAVMQQMNKEINAVSGIFKGAKVISTGHTGAIPAGGKPLPALPKIIYTLSTTGMGAVVSVMQNKKRHYLVVVNKDYTAKINLTVRFGNGVSRILKNGAPVSAGLSAKTSQIDPGDVAIYRW